MADERIGVYICHCGTNIAGTVDVEKVAQRIAGLPNVVLAKDYKYMCSEPGQAMIKQDIRDRKLNRVIVASCSPRMHEPTFRKAAQEAGLNPYLVEMANIREQCSWVHMKEPEKATVKAIALVAAAVAKSVFDEPLQMREVPVTPAALVIGGGIAGIQSSLDLADQGFKVHLVEKTPSIGGHMAQLDKTFPTLDCSACILTPKMVDISRHPNISLLAYSEVKAIDGYIGNFKARVLKKPRYVDESKCTGCGLCAEKCPVNVPSEFDLGLGTRKAIYVPFPQAVPLRYTIDRENCLYFKKNICRACEKFCTSGAIDFGQLPAEVELEVGAIIIATGYDLYDAGHKAEYGYGIYRNVINGLEFERLVNASGPTSGKVLRPSDGKAPRSVAFVQCVGSRDKNANLYCSRVCCMASLKQAHQIKEKFPGAEVSIFYIDMRCFGKGYEEFYERVQQEGVRFIRGRVGEILENPDDKNLVLRFEDTLLGEVAEREFDLAVLATGVIPRADTSELQSILKLSRGPDGFFLEAHPKLRPVETNIDGVFLGGAAQGPKDIPDAVAQAGAAASRAAVPLSMGKVELEGIIASVDEDLCSGCRICESVCEYGAIKMKEKSGKQVSSVIEVLCKGCGVCGSACPTKSIKMCHFTDDAILAQVKAVLRD
ncbi:MAG TPA: CoB--CoM heterodisulfide reductase iron-sulfur subunit A family protein [Candidatus Bathyarchaeia archaeon]|nr:MAG: disulfide reductase [Candidatus Bathyarchaeota archaeon RBG_16_48_13]HJX23414.1 CoB--CoM heterodisulfide reductase iron-sulfur subunit A family protein [Candidatus Bathyarchaeia archaeon]